MHGTLGQCFFNFRVYQNHLWGLIKYRFLDPTPIKTDLAGRRWHPGICISNKIPGHAFLLVQGPHFVSIKTVDAHRSESDALLCHSLIMCLWENYLDSPNLGFLVLKIKMMIHILHKDIVKIKGNNAFKAPGTQQKYYKYCYLHLSEGRRKEIESCPRRSSRKKRQRLCFQNLKHCLSILGRHQNQLQ